MPHRRWIYLTRVAAAAGLGLFAAYTLLAPPDDAYFTFFNTWVYDGLMVLACVIAGSHAYLVQQDRGAWTVITLALASWTFGEIYWAIVKPDEYPSPADWGYIGFYVLLYVGIVLLLRSRARSIGGMLWIDGATAALAAASLGAAVLVELVLGSTEGSTSVVVTNLAYPLGDVLLLSAVFGVFSLTGWKPGERWLLLGLGALATTIADAVYLFQSANGTYVEGTWIDILWPTSMLLVASAAWAHDRSRKGIDVVGRPLMAVPAAGALVATGILVYDHFTRLNILAIVLASLTLVLVIVRLAVTFRENSRLFALTRAEATTDSLTGLANRRQLVADLDRRLTAEPVAQTLLMLFDLDGFKNYNDTFGHPAGDALLVRLGAKLATVPDEDGEVYRLGGDEFCLIATLSEGEAEQLIDRACEALTEHGEGFEIGSSFGAVVLPDEATDASHALQTADERLYAQKYSRRGESERTMAALLAAISIREPELEAQRADISSLALEIGTSLGLRRDELAELERAAQLHDLGKLAVPDEILHKPGPLDDEEWAEIRRHPDIGDHMLKPLDMFGDARLIIRHHHERWDGDGYLDHLEGEQIPLIARILAVGDAFSAMTTTRPYRKALDVQEALRRLGDAAGSQLDETLVAAFIEGIETADDAPVPGFPSGPALWTPRVA